MKVLSHHYARPRAYSQAISDPAALLLVWVGVIWFKLISSYTSGSLGLIGTDSDDVMRLVQIKDFLTGGQSWGDMMQYRLGGPEGVLMHWSRLVDLPIIGLIKVFDIFMPYQSAEALAISIWPPLTSILVIWGVTRGAGFLGGRQAALFALIISALFILQSNRFSPGSIDHHNLQLGLLALGIGYGLDPKYRAKSGLISGLAIGLSFAVGADIYVLGAVVCIFVAVLWAIKGPAVKAFTAAFGLALSLVLAASYALVTAPANYGAVYCDSLSLITVLAGGLGGAGLALLSWQASNRSVFIRVAGLAALGVACAGLLFMAAPQCLANPLAAMPPLVHELWLSEIVEAQPLLKIRDDKLVSILFMAGVVVMASVYAAYRLTRPGRKDGYALLLGLLIVMMGFVLYQIRFYPFAHIAAFIALSALAAQCFSLTNAKGERRLLYIGALALAMPTTWYLMGAAMTGELYSSAKAEKAADKSVVCFSDNVMAQLATLPRGRVAATSNGAPEILLKTKHAALNGNYHRNFDGIYQALLIFTQPPAKSEALLRGNQIDYVLLCRTTRESTNLKDHSPSGLMAALLDGQVPDYLTPALPDMEGGAVTVYKTILKPK